MYPFREQVQAEDEEQVAPQPTPPRANPFAYLNAVLGGDPLSLDKKLAKVVWVNRWLDPSLVYLAEAECSDEGFEYAFVSFGADAGLGGEMDRRERMLLAFVAVAVPKESTTCPTGARPSSTATLPKSRSPSTRPPRVPR